MRTGCTPHAWQLWAEKGEERDHRVGRVLSFISSRRNWDFPNPSPAVECVPPPGYAGRGTAHSLAREGLGESQFRRWDIHCGTPSLIYTYFVLETVAVIRQQSRSFACRAIVTCFVSTGSYMSSAGRQQPSLRRQQSCVSKSNCHKFYMSRQQTHATVRCSPCVTGTYFLCSCTSHMSILCRQQSGVSIVSRWQSGVPCVQASVSVSCVHATVTVSCEIATHTCFSCSSENHMFSLCKQQSCVFCDCVQASGHMFFLCRQMSGVFCV
jgi:hypothetical protein